MTTTHITGTAYLADGNTADGAVLKCFKVLKSQALVSEQVVEFTADDSGAFDFQLIRDSVAYLWGNFPGFDADPINGTPVVIPDSSSATLESLQAAISIPEQVPVAVGGSGVPGGSGSQLQYRAGSTDFGGVAGSSVDGNGNITLDKSIRFNERASSQVIALTDTSTIALDASLGNRFKCSSADDRTLGAPSNPVGGQQIVMTWKNTDSADHTLSLASGTGGFRFGSDITGLTATVGGTKDRITAIYDDDDDRWDVVGYAKGF